MTRFARAKGSKASNERKPEEATSWSEMRSSMLSRKNQQQEEKTERNEPVKSSSTPKKTEWASLGDDTLSESISMLKQHVIKAKDSRGKENKKKKKQNNIQELSPNVGKKEKKMKMKIKNQSVSETVEDLPKSEKKKKKKKENTESAKEIVENLPKMEKKKKKEKILEIQSKKEKKNQKNSVLEDENPEISVKKKGKKRKLTESGVDSETVFPKKKKKVQKIENLEEKIVNTDNKQKQNMQKGVKSKQFRKENEGRGFKSKKGKQFERGKKFTNKNYQERNSAVEEIIINGEKIPIIKFQGFYVTLEDAERLKKLRSEMIKEGIPKAKLEAAIKLERRRAEKALSRLKKSVCFHCRGHGHLLSNCPNLLEKENTGTGICYKCGSTEHSAGECKVVRGTNYQFAECFICKEQGHIARQCPDNPRGLYPQGGACRECGDVTHLRKDCPKIQAQKAEEVVTVGLRRDRDLECLEEEIASRETQNSKKKVKKSSVKF